MGLMGETKRVARSFVGGGGGRVHFTPELQQSSSFARGYIESIAHPKLKRSYPTAMRSMQDRAWKLVIISLPFGYGGTAATTLDVVDDIV